MLRALPYRFQIPFGLVLAVVVTGLVGAAFAPVSGRLRGIYLGVASLSLVFLGWWLARTLPSLAGTTSSGRYAPDLTVLGFNLLGDALRDALDPRLGR